jgi:hypothetical protein
LLGLALHVPTILFWVSVEIEVGETFASIAAVVLSGLVSGLMYLILNGGVLKETKEYDGKRGGIVEKCQPLTMHNGAPRFVVNFEMKMQSAICWR